MTADADRENTRETEDVSEWARAGQVGADRHTHGKPPSGAARRVRGEPQTQPGTAGFVSSRRIKHRNQEEA